MRFKSQYLIWNPVRNHAIIGKELVRLTAEMSGQMKDGELSMKEIRRQIKEKQYHKVYLLTGDEEYLVGQAKNMLKNALVKDGDEMNCTLF